MQNPHHNMKGMQGMQGMKKPKLSEVDKFLESNQDLIMEAAHKVQQKIMSENEKCVSIQNEDKFVNCLQKVDQKVGNIQKKFEYRLHFWKLQTQQCFTDSPKDLDNCKSSSRANIRKYLDTFVKQL